MCCTYISQEFVDDLMVDLGPLGWTPEEVRDDIKHRAFEIPREHCSTCPSFTRIAELERTLLLKRIEVIATGSAYRRQLNELP